MKTKAWSVMKSVAALLVCAAAGLSAQAGTVTYYHNDLAGSPIVATNSSGSVVWRESYRPYGERLINSAAASGNKIWFTSRRQDPETGLVYMGARYYDPLLGRFVSMDPKQFDEANEHSFNRYAYANDNPYKYADPDGKSPLILWALGGYGAGVVADAVSQYAAWSSVDWKLALSSSAALSGVQAGLMSPAGGAGVGLTIKEASAAEKIVAETLAGKGNFTSGTRISADELLEAGERFLGKEYQEVGQKGSGVFRSADGTKQFRIDEASLTGEHAPYVPHGHFELFEPGAPKPFVNNHVPFQD